MYGKKYWIYVWTYTLHYAKIFLCFCIYSTDDWLRVELFGMLNFWNVYFLCVVTWLCLGLIFGGWNFLEYGKKEGAFSVFSSKSWTHQITILHQLIMGFLKNWAVQLLGPKSTFFGSLNYSIQTFSLRVLKIIDLGSNWFFFKIIAFFL
jgi:hypothetical protein